MNITKGRLVQIAFQKLGMEGSDTTTSGSNDELALTELELMIASRPELGIEWNLTEDANSQVQPEEVSGVTAAQAGPVTDMLAYNIARLFNLGVEVMGIWLSKYDAGVLNLTTRAKAKNTPTRINAGAFYDLSAQVYKNTQGIQYNLNSINILDGLVNSNADSIQSLNTQMAALSTKVAGLESEVATMKTSIQDNEVLSKINESNIDDIYNIIDSVVQVETNNDNATNLYVSQNTNNTGSPYNAAIWAGEGYSSYDFGSSQNLAVGSDGSINFVTNSNVSAGSFSGDQLTLAKAPIIDGNNLGDIIEDMQSRIYSLEQS